MGLLAKETHRLCAFDTLWLIFAVTDILRHFHSTYLHYRFVYPYECVGPNLTAYVTRPC
jgi:hypothetical protein